MHAVAMPLLCGYEWLDDHMAPTLVFDLVEASILSVIHSSGLKFKSPPLARLPVVFMMMLVCTADSYSIPLYLLALSI